LDQHGVIITPFVFLRSAIDFARCSRSILESDDVLPVATRAETAGGLKIQIPPHGDDALDNPVEHSRTTHTGPWRRLHRREHPVNGTCVMAGHIVGLISSAFPNSKVKPQELNLR